MAGGASQDGGRGLLRCHRPRSPPRAAGQRVEIRPRRGSVLWPRRCVPCAPSRGCCLRIVLTPEACRWQSCAALEKQSLEKQFPTSCTAPDVGSYRCIEVIIQEPKERTKQN
ncbi:uncharacterized protein [Anser cygnoides]|uniref:uncharacterized protein isoform X2 n=1 Tax=Anser cygnoides TaxID=8845 RepID=UPI0034D201F2